MVLPAPNDTLSEDELFSSAFSLSNSMIVLLIIFGLILAALLFFAIKLYFTTTHKQDTAETRSIEKLITSLNELYNDELKAHNEKASEPRAIIANPRDAAQKTRSDSIFERQSLRTTPVFRILFTGGPCSGKTTALASCADQLKQLGIKIFEVPEAAAILKEGGALIQKLEGFEAVLYQKHRMQLQMSLEDVFVDVGSDFHPDEPIVVLYPSGLMDGAAYLSKTSWQALLDDSGWNLTMLRDRRYDLVIHMVTAADGAQYYFKNECSEGNFTEEEAIKLDRNLQQVWIGHPGLRVIDNTGISFNEKIMRCLETIYKFLGFPCSTTLYKKLLVKIDEPDILALPDSIPYEVFDVEDTFLVSADPGTKEKVTRRKQIDSCMYTHTIIKLEHGQNILKNRQISAREYIRLLESSDKNAKVLQRKRQCFLIQRDYLKLDLYQNIDTEPRVLKIFRNFSSDEDISLPSAIKVLADVTDDARFDTYAISHFDWKMPKLEDLKPLKMEQKPKIKPVLNKEIDEQMMKVWINNLKKRDEKETDITEEAAKRKKKYGSEELFEKEKEAYRKMLKEQLSAFGRKENEMKKEEDEAEEMEKVVMRAEETSPSSELRKGYLEAEKMELKLRSKDK